MEISVIPVEEDEQPGGSARQLVHISRDITERRRTEQLREDIERVIRHDLKSPLNGIIGGAQLLLQDETLQQDQSQLLEAIYESGMSVLRMVNQSLDMYKMAEGRYELQAERFDIIPMLKRINLRWESQRKAKGVSLRFFLDGKPLERREHYSIYGEAQSIERLLANLIENAIDASPEHAAVTLRIEASHRSVRFDIHNMGAIPVEVRPRFFDRYVTHGKRRGTGLGTYSAWLIARAHGGQIDYTTDAQEGTHLIVELPADENRDA
jgi:K+-sensing histidine kinase KdpD